MKWRDLTGHEAATLPEARLGGSLLWAVVMAGLLCAVAVAGSVLAFAHLREIGLRYMLAVTFAAVWSLIFIVMTLLRVRQTPVVASVGFVAWIVYRLCVAVSDGPVVHWPLLIDGLGELILAAGFCGYMATAVRPNAYYRRRLPTL